MINQIICVYSDNGKKINIKVLVKENHIKHICKLFIIFVQLFLYVDIGWKREKNARQCLFVPYFNTSVYTYHCISLQFKRICVEF